ncbi:hypothetical protein F4604DRAFT_1939882 [Suillus subluteus]|nr:hypothetical protein F4604DRAFT_1939882 [Suillus subluteus]
MHFVNLVKIRLSSTSLLLVTIFGQTVIMGFAWGFTGGIVFTGVLALPDHIVYLIVEHPTVLTLIVTLISTTLSIITSMFFTFAVKEALRHHLSGPIALFELRTAIALSRPTWVLRWKSLKLSALTLAVYAVVTFLNTSWSTLLLPTLVQWPVATFGTELDLGSVAFVNQLSTDLNTPEVNTVVLLRLTFKEVCKRVVCSASTEFRTISRLRSTLDDSSNPPGSAVGLAFYGGRVPVNTSFDWGNLASDAGTQGIAQNYTVTQQGVTANVTCQPIDRSQNEFNLNPTQTQGPEITFFTWEAIANCSGNSNSQIYYTTGSVSGQIVNATEGFLPIVVCPDPLSTTFNPYKFGAAFVIFLRCLASKLSADVFMAGLYKYNFLPTTVCEVVPYLTTVNVTYNGGIISVDRIDASTSSPNFPLSQYIATVIAYQSGANQGMATNTIGDFLTAYGTSNVSVMHSELEDYWRGITEFASTQLRSGYSASGVPSNMTRSTSGTMYITTYGWRSQAHTYIFLLVEITMIWSVTILAAGYSLIQEKIHASDPSFDFSDPVDLIIAASVGRLQSEFCEGDGNDVDNSEDITVRFEDVPDKVGKRIGKRLVTVIPEPLPETA